MPLWRKNTVSQALWDKIAWLQRGNNLSLRYEIVRNCFGSAK